MHFFYAVPLILALVHRFFDCDSWLSLLLAMSLFALQTVGNLPYYIPVSSLVVVLYFGLYTAFNWQTQLAASLSVLAVGLFYLATHPVAAERVLRTA